MLYLIQNLLRDLFRPRADLLLENMALRQQINVLRRDNPKPHFTTWDRAFWVALLRCWEKWRRPLALVKPQTVIAWHRRGWRLFWKWKSRPKEVGRPRVPYEVIELIKRMSRENPNWGAPRIHGELMKLGHFVSESTVARYMIKRRGRPTQDWKTFIRNHIGETAAIDFLTVPTIMFRTLYVFVVLSLDRRRIVHINVTTNPTADWTAVLTTSPQKHKIRDSERGFGPDPARCVNQEDLRIWRYERPDSHTLLQHQLIRTKKASL